MLTLRIPLKGKLENPIEVDGVNFTIDYPTPEQEEFLEKILMRVWNLSDPKEYRSEIKELRKKIESTKEKKTKLELEKKLLNVQTSLANDPLYRDQSNESLSLMLKYQRYVIKFSVKHFDEKMIKDTEGNFISCKVINNELEDSLWWALVKDPILTIRLYTKINEAIEHSYADKKKVT